MFFTVNLLDRGSDLLVSQVDLLRGVVRRTKADKPFRIDAWVVGLSVGVRLDPSDAPAGSAAPDATAQRDAE